MAGGAGHNVAGYGAPGLVRACWGVGCRALGVPGLVLVHWWRGLGPGEAVGSGLEAACLLMGLSRCRHWQFQGCQAKEDRHSGSLF